jgi:aryl-alcohol dehydrogenase-like predicted oxidoreductase
LLTGRYQAEGGLSGEGRLQAVKNHPAFSGLFTERNWRIAGELLKIAKEIGRTPAQVALNWVANRPAVSSTIIGATKIKQLEDNLAALDFTIPTEQLLRLDDISATEVPYPYYFFTRKEFREMVSGGTNVSPTAVQRVS